MADQLSKVSESQGSAAVVSFIFDCDGTLMDTIEAWHAAEDKLMEETGISLTKKQRDELNSLTLDEAGDFFYNNFAVLESPDQVRQLIIDHMLNYYETEAEMNPGAGDFVKGLYGQGIPLVVLSSSPQSFLQAGFTRTGFTPYFKSILSVEDLTTTKRDPETYEHICNLMGTDPSRTWFFDDSWYAIRTAHQAGLRTVGVFSKDECGTHGELGRYADLVIDSFEDIDWKDFI